MAYSPTNTQDAGDIFILSNDPSTPEAVVHLYGVGLIPLLQFDPPVLDLGYASVGDTVTGIIDIVNAGGDVLDVSLVAVLGEGFIADSVPALSLAPGDRHPVEVSFTPSLESNYAGEIWADSNTPAGSTKADITATSIEKPVAICSATPRRAVRPVRHGHLHRLRLYDPSGGEIVGWEWALISKPEGSSVAMPSGTGLTVQGSSPISLATTWPSWS